MKDLKNDIAVAVALDIQAITTDTTTDGNVIDLQDYEGCTFLFSAGTLTDGTYTPVIEESDVVTFGGEETAVADTDLIGTEALAAMAATDDDTVKTLGYTGSKRYVRFTVTSASTSTGGTLGCNVIKSHGLTRKETLNENLG